MSNKKKNMDEITNDDAFEHVSVDAMLLMKGMENMLELLDRRIGEMPAGAREIAQVPRLAARDSMAGLVFSFVVNKLIALGIPMEEANCYGQKLMQDIGARDSGFRIAGRGEKTDKWLDNMIPKE